MVTTTLTGFSPLSDWGQLGACFHEELRSAMPAGGDLRGPPWAASGRSCGGCRLLLMLRLLTLRAQCRAQKGGTK